jgi:nondiscriminating aspartyl-tRNA synthetase
VQRIRTTEFSAHIGERIYATGWVHAIRRFGGITFVVLRDGWGTAQVVTEDDGGSILAAAGPETVVGIEGIVESAPKAPGGVELRAAAMTVLSTAEPPPVAMGKRTLGAGLPTLLDQAVVLNRHPSRRALMRLSAGAMSAFRSALDERGFTEIQSPKFVASATEGGANVFAVDYFGRPAYLAQSPQFYKQIMVGVFERVYEVGPVFRAEPHDTIRHLSEYVSLDVEMGFIRDHTTVMAVLRDVIAAMVGRLGTRFSAELALVEARLPVVPAEIPRLHFTEAKEIAWSRTGSDERGEPDLSPAEERALGAWAEESHGSDFVFVTGYPMVKRPFYTHPEPGRPEYSHSFDLLFRGLELVTGGQRLHRHQDYLDVLARAGMSIAPFTAYLDAFRHGMPPHGGFAIGLERFIMQVTGQANIRLATTFPRDLGRLAP